MTGKSGAGFRFRNGGTDGAIAGQLQGRQRVEQWANDDRHQVLQGETMTSDEHRSEGRQRVVDRYVTHVHLESRRWPSVVEIKHKTKTPAIAHFKVLV